MMANTRSRNRSRRRIRSRNEDLDDKISVVVPEDVLIKVFLWLPVKSLLKFRCLSKQWLQIISNDSHFINKFAISKLPLLFCLSKLSTRCQRYVQSCINLETGTESRRFKLSKKIFNCRFILPTRFDVVCFLSSGHEFHILNPTTHELITLPLIYSFYHGSLGFGYVESTNEYKLVHLVHPHSDTDFLPPREYTECWVFTLGMTKDSPSSYASPWAWKKIGNSPYHICFDQSPAFVDGVLYWLIDRKHHPEIMINVDHTILSFNLESEEFGVLPRPSGCIDLTTIHYSKGLQLVEMTGLLCLSFVASNKMDIWMLMKDSQIWVQEYSIDLSPLMNILSLEDHYFRNYVPRDIIQDDDGNINLFIESSNKPWIYYYNLQMASFTQFIFREEGMRFFSFCRKSLVSLRHVVQRSSKFDQIAVVTHSQSQELEYTDPPTYVVRVSAFFCNPDKNAYGGYITDFKGLFFAIEGKLLDAEDSIEAEAKAILYGLLFARGQGIKRIALVSNAKELVDAINVGERKTFQSLENILTMITYFLSGFSWAQIFHDRRMSTQVAHQLARKALHNESYGQNIEFVYREPPEWFIDG